MLPHEVQDTVRAEAAERPDLKESTVWRCLAYREVHQVCVARIQHSRIGKTQPPDEVVIDGPARGHRNCVLDDTLQLSDWACSHGIALRFLDDSAGGMPARWQ